MGRHVECPECQVKLVISLDTERNVVAERPKEPEVKKKAAPRIVAPAIRAGSTVGRRLADLVRSPLAIAWALAIGVTAFVAIVMLRPAVRFRAPTEKPLSPVAANNSEQPHDQAVQPDDDASLPESPTPPVDPMPPIDPVVETRATELLPADVPSAENVANANPVKSEKANPPVAIPPKVPVEELFKQPLKGFVTGKPLSRKALLAEVEELLGRPIRYNREELGDNLERTMSINLEATTVGGVLKVVLDSGGWDYVVEEDGIRLKPRRVAEKS